MTDACNTTPATPTKAPRQPSPQDKANIISKVCYFWLNSLITLGNKKYLEEDDLYEVPAFLDSRRIKGKVSAAWSQQVVDGAAPSMKAALKSLYSREYWLGGLAKCLADVSFFGSPLVLRELLKFIIDSRYYQVTGVAKPEAYLGYIYATLLFIIPFIGALLQNVAMRTAANVGASVRTALITAMMEKILKLSAAARATLSTGKIINLITTDISKIEMCLQWFHTSWVSFIQIAIAIGLLIHTIGVSALVGIGVILLLLPVQGFVLIKMFTQFASIVVFSDKRLKMTNEMLQGVRVLKLYNWESAFAKKVSEIRQNEMAIVKQASYLRSYNTFFMQLGPIFMSVLSFIVLGATRGADAASADKVFTALTFFNLIQYPIMLFPMMVGFTADALVAMGRLDAFFNAEELNPQALSLAQTSENAIEIRNAEFSWEISLEDAKKAEEKAAKEGKQAWGKAKKPKTEKKAKTSEKNKTMDESGEEEKKSNGEATAESQAESKTAEEKSPEKKKVDSVLKEISLNIKKGSLTAIVGSVGSGKSSLLSGLLGEMKKLQGEVGISGSLAYCPQQAWIQNATVKQNILFGLPYDEEKYRNAVKMCSLEHDIEILPSGDNTEIGERGINLSGGQKQRVSLARALYFSADTVLLDDVLSACDAHVGKFIFDHCIQGSLAGKTRVLVTHQLQYLSHCDYIVFLKEGRIAEQGTFSELMQGDQDFMKLMQDFGGQSKKAGGNSTEEPESQKKVAKVETLQASKALDKDKIELMQVEERARGGLGWAVYRYYFAALGGLFMVGMCLFWLVVQSGSNIMTNLFLSYFTSDKYNQSTSWYLGIYAALAVATAIFTLFSVLSLAKATIEAAKSLHDQSFLSLLQAPTSFFDTTPIGRIMNRFSKDQEIIDTQLGEMLRQFVSMFIGAISVFIMMCILEPEFTAALLPCAVLYGYYQHRYRRANRELKRLDAISRSPLFAHFSETLTGLSTIRAYKLQQNFIEANADKMNAQNRPHYIVLVDERYIGVRLETIGALIVFCAAVIIVIQRDTFDPGLAGLSLSYALQITSAFFWLVRQSVEAENSMNSVERSKYYTSQIEHEDLTVESGEVHNSKALVPVSSRVLVEKAQNRAHVDKDWPSKGKIEINQLEIRYRVGLPLVLKKVTATIRGGERVGVVGRTGAGKVSHYSNQLSLVLVIFLGFLTNFFLFLLCSLLFSYLVVSLEFLDVGAVSNRGGSKWLYFD
jgi:ATP-binding cassette subfamily C (CFTR/MRP) protein 1